ncbi:HARB1 nuclease, partial [Amia calva]|nr:HARB1 nuclease [Amia calva]
VCVIIRFYATGSFLNIVGDFVRIHKSAASRIVHQVSLALKRKITQFVAFPETGFPNIVSAVNRAHIRIQAPNYNENVYVNRKGYHSINVQLISEGNLLINNISARWPGSVLDSRIVRESNLGQRFEQGRFDGLLLGDRGYPCLRYLMTPYPDPQTREQIKYNVKYNMAHSNTRVRIEMTFGFIKACFACLQGLQVHLEQACEVVAACVVLHNIATIRKERAPCQLLIPPDVVDPVTLDHSTGRAVRKAITNQLFHQ